MSKFEKFAGIFDVHGDKQDKATVQGFLHFCEQFKPRFKFIGGDLFDFRPLRARASQEEKAQGISDDWAAGFEFLKAFRPHVFLRGNHDERLHMLADNAAGLIGDFARQGVRDLDKICRQLKVNMVEYCKRRGVYPYGNYRILHGYGHGISAVRGHAFSYGRCFFGHTHARTEYRPETWERMLVYECGCACELDMDYNRATRSTLRQEHSWVYGVRNKATEEITAHLALETSPGEFYTPTEFFMKG